MEKSPEIIYGVIERMALISDAIDNLFVNGRKVIVIELNKIIRFRKGSVVAQGTRSREYIYN